LNNAFDDPGYDSGAGPFSFIFSTGGTNPIKACAIGSFEVSTYRVIGSTNYIIDYKKFVAGDPTFTAFTPIASLLNAQIIEISNSEASAIDVSYSFAITP
jgi:hypothetical protein